MRTSNLFFPTLKETPAEAELISHQLMLRAGMIRKLASGLYTYLPLGLKVLRKVEQVVRQEMALANAQEIIMPIVQPKELWQESERWDQYGPMLLKMQDRQQREFCFGPTHEEIVTNLVRNELNSYKQLPLTLYQINTKFRDEIRPRFGLMRAREFMMKDAYSFHSTAESLATTYQRMYQAYCNIFTTLGLEYRAVLAATGEIGGSVSHEFHVIAAAGEDELVYDPKSDYAANIEVAKDNTLSPAGNTLQRVRGIEVGHIFQLGTKYSTAMQATVLDNNGKNIPLMMGCYGIGVSRIVAASIEQHHDANGIIWPAALAPFSVVIVPIGYKKSELVRTACDKLYQALLDLNIEVLLDDRDARPGVLFADMDLIGIPRRIVIGTKHLAANNVEFKTRVAADPKIVNINEVIKLCS